VSEIEIDITRQLPGFALAARLTVPERGISALFGRSGSGKTTLVHAIAGVIRPDEGHIRVGTEVFFDHARGINQPIEERGVGCVFQDSRLLPHLSVVSNLRYGLARARRRGRQQTIHLDAVVDLLGIRSVLHRHPQGLSGGERQRVAIGRALLAQPRVLLMDEPLASLDMPRRSEILRYIERLRDDFALPIVYVSHSIDEIIRLADHLTVLSDGRTVATGELISVMSDPANAPLFGRYEAGVVLDCLVVRHEASYQLTVLSFPGGELRVPQIDLAAGAHVRVHLRAREVALSLAEINGTTISNQLRGRLVELVPRNGPYIEALVAVGPTFVRALVTRESRERLKLEPGVEVWILIKATMLDRHSVAL